VDPAPGITVAELFHWLTGGEVSEALLDWAPDVAALTTVLLERSHAFRFVVSPPEDARWPPADDPPYGVTVTEAATAWQAMMDGPHGGAPELVRQLWTQVLAHQDVSLDELSTGRPWAACQAVLMLHSIADEAAAGCAGSGSASGAGATHLARAHEMLARRGSLARLPADRVLHLPKTRTTPVGMTHRSLSRYGATTTQAVPAVWHRAPLRRLGGGPAARHANVVLLPWPLRIRESDFEPVPGSIRRPEREPFGFFRYVPSDPLDLDLVDQLLEAALDEVDGVDVAVLPEGCLEESDVPELEAVLARRGVTMLVAGLRIAPAGPGRMPGNGVHVGMLNGDTWWHYRQHKHHRWFLDAGQVEQYNIAGALHPGVRWWEEMEVPARSVNVFELAGGITIAAVVCEDLARLDGVAELLRAIGPTIVVTLLLDGPQLASRWTARYAGVLADDPGSAVLTLTAYGMATRSRPRGLPPSGVVAMWKDPSRGMREIPLESGAQGVLLKASFGRAPRYAADGRRPMDDATDLYVTGVHQLRVHAGHGSSAASSSAASSSAASSAAEGSTPAQAVDCPVDTVELSVLWSWAEGFARAGTGGTAAVEQVLAEARVGAPWRAALGVTEPSGRLGEALAELDAVGRRCLLKAGTGDPTALLAALQEAPAGEGPVGRLVRRLLRTALDAALPSQLR
jgi:hypothetical protein